MCIDGLEITYFPPCNVTPSSSPMVSSTDFFEIDRSPPKPPLRHLLILLLFSLLSEISLSYGGAGERSKRVLWFANPPAYDETRIKFCLKFISANKAPALHL